VDPIGPDDESPLNEPRAADSAASSDLNAERVEGHVEAALADAARAGRWDVVALLARELEARRRGRDPPP